MAGSWVLLCYANSPTCRQARPSSRIGTSCLAVAFGEGKPPHKLTPVPDVRKRVKPIAEKSRLWLTPSFAESKFIHKFIPNLDKRNLWGYK